MSHYTNVSYLFGTKVACLHMNVFAYIRIFGYVLITLYTYPTEKNFTNWYTANNTFLVFVIKHIIKSTAVNLKEHGQQIFARTVVVSALLTCTCKFSKDAILSIFLLYK